MKNVKSVFWLVLPQFLKTHTLVFIVGAVADVGGWCDRVDDFFFRWEHTHSSQQPMGGHYAIAARDNFRTEFVVDLLFSLVFVRWFSKILGLLFVDIQNRWQTHTSHFIFRTIWHLQHRRIQWVWQFEFFFFEMATFVYAECNDPTYSAVCKFTQYKHNNCSVIGFVFVCIIYYLLVEPMTLLLTHCADCNSWRMHTSVRLQRDTQRIMCGMREA